MNNIFFLVHYIANICIAKVEKCNLIVKWKEKRGISLCRHSAKLFKEVKGEVKFF